MIEKTLPIALGMVLMAGQVVAPRGELAASQAPRGAEIQAPRGEDIQAPRDQERQAPRGTNAEATRD
jgi:hypothetical protein